MAYATCEDVEKGFRELTEEERQKVKVLLERAAIFIDTVAAPDIAEDVKGIVSCNMVTRAIASGDIQIPIGATQTSQSGLGYSQSVTFGSGASGELYLSKMDKRMLGIGNRIGFHSPVEDI